MEEKPTEQMPSEQMPAPSTEKPEGVPQAASEMAPEGPIQPADEEKIAAVREELNANTTPEQPQGEEIKVNVDQNPSPETPQVPPQEEKKSFWDTLLGR